MPPPNRAACVRERSREGLGDAPVSTHSARTRDIPDATVARLPLYLRALTDFTDRGIVSLSSEELASAAGVRSTQLRKDLSHLGSYGVRGVGYDPVRLTQEIAAVLGLTQDWPVAIVGMGNLGRALAAYSGFATGGFRLVALLDHDPAVVGQRIGSLLVAAMPRLPELVRRHGIAIGVIATPSASAQGVCDALAAAGVTRGAELRADHGGRGARCDVRRVDIATELHMLAFTASSSGLPTWGWPDECARAWACPTTQPPSRCWSRSAWTPQGTERLAHRVAAAEAVEGASCSARATGSRCMPSALTFHGALTEIGDALAAEAGSALETLREHLYVHYEDRARRARLLGCGRPGLDGRRRGRRSSASCATRCAPASERARLVPEELERCCSRPCGSASARTPRPGSTGSASPSCSPGSAAAARRSGRSSRRRCSSSVPAG